MWSAIREELPLFTWEVKYYTGKVILQRCWKRTITSLGVKKKTTKYKGTKYKQMKSSACILSKGHHKSIFRILLILLIIVLLVKSKQACWLIKKFTINLCHVLINAPVKNPFIMSSHIRVWMSEHFRNIFNWDSIGKGDRGGKTVNLKSKA